MLLIFVLCTFTRHCNFPSFVFLIIHINVFLLCLFVLGQDLVSEQEIQNEEAHKKRRASTGAQPELQRPHGVQLSTVPGRLGHTGPVQAAQPTATEYQHDAV